MGELLSMAIKIYLHSKYDKFILCSYFFHEENTIKKHAKIYLGHLWF